MIGSHNPRTGRRLARYPPWRPIRADCGGVRGPQRAGPGPDRRRRFPPRRPIRADCETRAVPIGPAGSCTAYQRGPGGGGRPERGAKQNSSREVRPCLWVGAQSSSRNTSASLHALSTAFKSTLDIAILRGTGKRRSRGDRGGNPRNTCSGIHACVAETHGFGGRERPLFTLPLSTEAMRIIVVKVQHAKGLRLRNGFGKTHGFGAWLRCNQLLISSTLGWGQGSIFACLVPRSALPSCPNDGRPRA